MEFGVAKIAGKTAITLDEELAARITGALKSTLYMTKSNRGYSITNETGRMQNDALSELGGLNKETYIKVVVGEVCGQTALFLNDKVAKDLGKFSKDNTYYINQTAYGHSLTSDVLLKKRRQQAIRQLLSLTAIRRREAVLNLA